MACTKSFLEQHARRVRISNPLTLELQRQIGNVVGNTVVPIVIPGGWNWSEYRALKNALLNIRQSHWQDERKEDFLACAQSVVNLLNTAVFSMSDMESVIAEAQINPDVTSPKARIEKLWDIADGLDTMQEVCAIIADAVETNKHFYMYCPHEDCDFTKRLPIPAGMMPYDGPTPFDEKPLAAPLAPPAPEKPKLTIVELRAFVAERSTPENRTKIKAILTKYGVKKLTELKETQYEAVKNEVAAL